MTFDERMKRFTRERLRTALLLFAVTAFAGGFLSVGFAAGVLVTREPIPEAGLLGRCVIAAERAMPIVLWADSVRHLQMDAIPEPVERRAEDGA